MDEPILDWKETMLEIITFVQGPVETNTYLVGDDMEKQAVVIDPAWDGKPIVAEATRRGWQINGIWLTHAHFDHIAGAAGVAAGVKPAPPVALHPDDLPLYEMQGGAPLFGLRLDPGPKPQVQLAADQLLQVGADTFQVRHTPGHTPGHVVFYCARQKVVFCGDVIFRGSIGRTDLPGGSYETLIQSIETKILTLPDETILYSGHGPETKVGIERAYNPFLG
jgi:hydroxyacylglutathione hydrolase